MGNHNSINSVLGITTAVSSSPYTVLAADYILDVDTSSARTINLPTAASTPNGKTVIIKDVTGSAATNNITVQVTGGANIDGSATIVLNTAYAVMQFFCNGANWFSLTEAPSMGSSFTWQATSTASFSAAANNGYILTSASNQTVTLPTTIVVGALIEVAQTSAGGFFTIAQNAGQTIQDGAQVTTSGTGGSLVATQAGNAVRLVCTTANNVFQVISSIGNLTVN